MRERKQFPSPPYSYVNHVGSYHKLLEMWKTSSVLVNTRNPDALKGELHCLTHVTLTWMCSEWKLRNGGRENERRSSKMLCLFLSVAREQGAWCPLWVSSSPRVLGVGPLVQHGQACRRTCNGSDWTSEGVFITIIVLIYLFIYLFLFYALKSWLGNNFNNIFMHMFAYPCLMATENNRWQLLQIITLF